MPRVILTLLLLCQPFCLPSAEVGFVEPAVLGGNSPAAPRVVVVTDPSATRNLAPQQEAVENMVRKGLQALAGRERPSDAWHTLVSAQDVVGIKVHSAPGPVSGTRPAVAAALIRSLLASGHPPGQVILWDRRLVDLRTAGFEDLATSLGVRIAGALDSGFDPAVAYENPMLGTLVYGDLEFERANRGLATNTVAGRRSHLSKLLTGAITKHVIVASLLSHNLAGVSGVLYTMSSAATDNFIRFGNNANLLATAVPEIFNQPQIADRIGLCVVDALLGQYEGGQRSLLHRSSTLNELRFSRDPVALDTLSSEDIAKLREAAGVPSPTGASTNRNAICANAALLELGVDDLSKIDVLHVRD